MHSELLLDLWFRELHENHFANTAAQPVLMEKLTQKGKYKYQRNLMKQATLIICIFN
jgi:hypothetical protein